MLGAGIIGRCPSLLLCAAALLHFLPAVMRSIIRSITHNLCPTNVLLCFPMPIVNGLTSFRGGVDKN